MARHRRDSIRTACTAARPRRLSPASGRLRWIPRSRAPCPMHSTTSPSSPAP